MGIQSAIVAHRGWPQLGNHYPSEDPEAITITTSQVTKKLS